MSGIASLKGLESFPERRRLALRLEELWGADPAVKGVALRGSVARGDADHFSDLDFVVVVADEAYLEVLSRREEFFRQAGALAYWFVSPHRAPEIFVGVYEGLEEVNACYVQLSKLEPEPSDSPWVVLKDQTDGWLTAVARESEQLALPMPEPVSRPDDKFWLWAYRTIVRVQRGELWHAMHMLEAIRELLIRLLTEQARKPWQTLRHFPRVLDKTDERWLAATVCALEPRAILTALSAAMGLYTSLRARRGESPTDARSETQVKRLLQNALMHQH